MLGLGLLAGFVGFICRFVVGWGSLFCLRRLEVLLCYSLVVVLLRGLLLVVCLALL